MIAEEANQQTENKKDPYFYIQVTERNTKKRTALCSLKNDAPCLTYVNSDTSLYQNSCGGYLIFQPIL